MPGPHDEHTFETGVVHDLTTMSGWTERPSGDFNRDLLMVPADLEAFLDESQPDKVEQLQQRLGASWLRKTCQIISRGLKQPGDVLTLLRKGKVVSGVHIDLAYYKPTHGKNPQTVARYASNQLTVIRQVPYSSRRGNTLDLVLFVNGLPVADAELKNGTSQVTDDAVEQYQNDRNSNDPFFKTRSVVHFAVDPNTVMMSTAVGTDARFLPFNRGSSEHGLAGAGNYQPADRLMPTSYLWRDVWARDAWMDLIQAFIHVAPADPDDPTSQPTLIFPRYHQWECVLQYVATARQHGPGRNELAMHSTGSGKTMTQAWLAHRLANLFDPHDNKVFDKVVVLTDRRVLDRNMQRQIEAFEQKSAKGLVESITEDSQQLKQALESSTVKVIVTTIQKFPYIVRDVDAKGANFAVIIDEAHSSQSGESAAAMKQALTSVDTDDEEELLSVAAEVAAEYAPDDGDDPAGDLAEVVAASRGRQEHISMFAFTATPKSKTLNQFGQHDTSCDQMRPTHVYSMRQAIEEGFIENMLANYTTYKTYYRVATSGGEVTSEKVDKSKALAAVRRYVSLHPHEIGQKVEIIVEHFREKVQQRINGKAKAMVVTSSRLHAVRYKRALDRYIANHGYEDLQALVAFSGKVIDPSEAGEEYTEPGMNGFPETQTEGKFDSDDYQIMVVAEKYQTGFSQPLIHTIYVDKKLSGINAVQTLSRGNRIHPAKKDPFVLDFVNDIETIEEAYKPYLGEAAAPPADPQTMYETWEAVDDFNIIEDSDVTEFAQVWFDPEFNPTRTDAAQKTKAAAASQTINATLNAAKNRFGDLDDSKQEEFRSLLRNWVRQYGFLAQMITWSDRQFEERYQYARLLSNRIAEKRGDSMDISDDLLLTHYKLDKTHEGSIDADADGALPPAFGSGGGSVLTEEEQVSLSDVLSQINDKYGLNLDDRHLLFVEQTAVGMSDQGEVQQAAGHNSAEKFIREFFVDRLIGQIMRTADDNYDFAELVANKPEIAAMFEGPLGKSVWRLAREKNEQAGS